MVNQRAWDPLPDAYKKARFKRVWDSYRPFRDDQFQWFRIAENSYDNFAFTAAAR